MNELNYLEIFYVCIEFLTWIYTFQKPHLIPIALLVQRGINLETETYQFFYNAEIVCLSHIKTILIL